MTPYGCTFGDRQMCLIPNCPWPNCEDDMTESQVLIDVALLELAVVIAEDAGECKFAFELAALIPTDPACAECVRLQRLVEGYAKQTIAMQEQINRLDPGNTRYPEGHSARPKPDPMAEAREVLARAMEAMALLGPLQAVRDGREDDAVEVIHTALNAPRPTCECLKIIDRRIETWRASGVDECLNEVPVLRSIRDAIVAASPQPRADLVSKDDAEIALFNAINAVKIGNQTDDKLILRNLRAAGYWLVRACSQCGGAPIRDVLDGDALCQSCCDKWARAEGAAQFQPARKGDA